MQIPFDDYPDFDDLTKEKYRRVRKQFIKDLAGMGYEIPTWEELTLTFYKMMRDATFFNIPKIGAPCKKTGDVDTVLEGAIQFAELANSVSQNIILDDTEIKDSLKLEPNRKRKFEKHFVTRDPVGGIVGQIHRETALSVISSLSHLFSTNPIINWWGKAVTDNVVKRARARLQFKVVKKTIKLAIVGSTQSGKTTVFSTLYFLYPVLLHVLSNGTLKSCPIIDVPPSSSLREQTKKTLEAVFKQLNGLVIKNAKTGFSTSIADYWQMMAEDGLFDDDESYDNMVVIRSSKGKTSARDSWKRALRKGYAPIISFIDEPHHGDNIGGIQDRLNMPIKGVETSQISIGATCDGQAGAGSTWSLVPMVLGLNYYGPHAYDGMRLPYSKGYQPAAPTVKSIKPEFEALLNYSKFAKYSATQKKEYVKTTFRLVEAGRELRPDANAALLRVCRANKHYSDDFLPLLREIYPDIDDDYVFMPFYGQDIAKENITIKSLCRQAKREGKFAVILVTARARMGDVAPADAQIFIDYSTGKKTTIATILQGTYGRATGYGKQDSLVIVKEHVAWILKTLKKYNYDLGRTAIECGTKIGWRTRLATSRFEHHLSSRVVRNIKLFSEFNEEPFHQLEQVWNSSSKPTRGAVIDPDVRRFNKELMRIFDNKFLQGLSPVKPVLWGQVSPVTGKPLKLVTLSREISERRGAGRGASVSFCWYDSREHEAAKGGGDSSRRRRDEIAIHCTIHGVCQIHGDINPIYRNIKKSLEPYQRQGGHWKKHLKDFFRQNMMCCWAAAKLDIISMSFRLQKPATARSCLVAQFDDTRLRDIDGNPVYEATEESRFYVENDL